MVVVNELDGLEGVSVPMPYASTAAGRCQEVVDVKGAAELVSP